MEKTRMEKIKWVIQRRIEEKENYIKTAERDLKEMLDCSKRNYDAIIKEEVYIKFMQGQKNGLQDALDMIEIYWEEEEENHV